MPMKHYENHDIENRLYQEGYQFIAGTDEVGRGPLIGPVTAAAVIMPVGCIIEGVTDSKKVSEKNRNILYDEIIKKALSYSIVFIDAKKIDEINILEASRLAMMEALKNLKIKPDYILADAMKLDVDVPTEAIIKGDSLSFTIGCASILAKVARDNYMDELDKIYPEFELKKNKGYPTKAHRDAIIKYGICKYHRRSFGPVRIEEEKKNYYKEVNDN